MLKRFCLFFLLCFLEGCCLMQFFEEKKPVKKNGIVLGVVSSSSTAPQKSVEQGVQEFENLGFDLKISPTLYEIDRFSAGTDESRLEELYQMYEDKSVHYIFQAQGGYGATRLLNKIDWNRLKKNPKIMIGLSDTTALQNAIFAKTGIPGYTGFILKKRFSNYEIPQSLLDLLNHKDVSYDLMGDAQVSVQGTLVGGCLTLVDALIGTPYMPKLDGAILILEDIHEKPYVIDRLLTHLENAGVFNKVSAVVFGVFLDCISSTVTDGTIEEVLDEWKVRIKKPVFTNFNYGHHYGSDVWPIGKIGTIKNNILTVKAK